MTPETPPQAPKSGKSVRRRLTRKTTLCGISGKKVAKKNRFRRRCQTKGWKVGQTNAGKHKKQDDDENQEQAKPTVKDPKKEDGVQKKGQINRTRTVEVRRLHFRLGHRWRTPRSSSPTKQARQ